MSIQCQCECDNDKLQPRDLKPENLHMSSVRRRSSATLGSVKQILILALFHTPDTCPPAPTKSHYQIIKKSY